MPKSRLDKAEMPSREAMRLHPFYRGKVQILPKCPIRDPGDFAIWYTPGVAEPCRVIEREPERVYDLTNKGNCIAVVSDGTRVLGLGDIGPLAALPVMEGKALLFKYLGGVDAVPLCLDTSDPEELVGAVRLLSPSFGGINLEDISQPKCFTVLDELRGSLAIPVWHDDQQGSATVLLAALRNALAIVGKEVSAVKLALIGVGAAGVATYRLLIASGVDPAGIIACDSTGTLHSDRIDLANQRETFVDKWRIATATNPEKVDGGITAAMRGADVTIAFSQPGPDVIAPEDVRGMANNAIVFACANPVPEIWPWVAREAGARIVGTGRSDFPNQVNNSLGFPGIFRGVLDVRARNITDGMALAASEELARCASIEGLHEEHVVPRMDEWEIYPRIAVATAMRAMAEGEARLPKTEAELSEQARHTIRTAREATDLLVKEGAIPLPPPP
jgi:malate dehydrogenase (oxaloacetate-decarboxylating)